MLDLPISLHYRLLILAESKRSFGHDDLSIFDQSTNLSATLGRLQSLNYIKKKSRNAKDKFILTTLGDKKLSDILQSLPHSKNSWDKKWRIVILDVPNTKRVLRQKLRNKLFESGARMLQAGIWISPRQRDVEKFMSTLDNANSSDMIYSFTTDTLFLSRETISKLWNLNELEHQYVSLFKKIQNNYQKLKSSSENDYIAKCMIVSLALISSKDPLLSPNFMPKNWIGFKGIEWYNKLRIYCK